MMHRQVTTQPGFVVHSFPS